jgi:aminoglycoside N3'-acetyltransferase
VWSDGDVAIGRTAAEACAGYVTGDYRFVALSGVTHWIPDEAPAALGEAVLAQVATGRLYRRATDILPLGVGHGSNTSLHLAEYRLPTPSRERVGAAVRTADGGRKWVWWEDVALDAGDFDRLGVELDGKGLVRMGQVGGATCRLMGQRPVVDFAVDWMTSNR